MATHPTLLIKELKLQGNKEERGFHSVKSVRIRSYFGPHFPSFGLNTERYGVSPCIQSEKVKMRTRITRNTATFYAVFMLNMIKNQQLLSLLIQIQGLPLLSCVFETELITKASFKKH